MRAVAKRLIFRHATAAQRNYRAAGQSKLGAVGVLYSEIALNPYRSILQDRNYRRHAS
jgi:hypothetical protein